MIIAKKNLLKTLLQSLLLAVIFTTFILPQNSYAQSSGIGRVRTCTGDGKPSALLSGLQQAKLGDSPDLHFDLSNGVCFGIAVGSYLIVKAAITTMNSACSTGSGIRVTPSIFLDVIDVAKSIKNNIPPKASCSAAIIGTGIALGTFVGILGIEYLIAEKVYKDAKICGSNWRKANPDKYDFSSPGYQQDVNSRIEGWIQANTPTSLANLNLEDPNNKTYREWYYGGVEVEDNPYGYVTSGITSLSASYDPTSIGGGVSSDGVTMNGLTVDAQDSKFHHGSTPCLDPTTPKANGKYPRQKYYMKGAQVSNFNCRRYQVYAGQDDPNGNPGDGITPGRLQDFRKAHSCCKERARNHICIEYAGEKTFCKAGSRCHLQAGNAPSIAFDAVRTNNNLICAQTYSLCPYNFAVGGGSDTCVPLQDGKKNSSGRWVLIDPKLIEEENCGNESVIRDSDCVFNSKAGKCENYCQQLAHCTTTYDSTYKYESNLGSPYFSSACYDFVGDSRNQTSFRSGVILGSQRHFSAPIAQCVKETIENVFYNRFGHSKCSSYGEYPSSKGICSSNSYEDFYDISDVMNTRNYRKGEQVNDQSFFTILQNNLQMAVKVLLSLAVAFYGMKILLGGGEIKKSDIIMFVTKIGLVLYFATGNAWQTQFFDGVYGTSNQLSKIVFKIDVNSQESQRDGCQFGDITTFDGGVVSSSASNPYPKGKEYLAIWDTLDCKIARYLGFGPEASAANIAILVFSGVFTGPYGLYFSMAVMFFGFFLLAATIRALHIFLSSAISIIMMVYISPVIIPTIMFGKTSNIFKSWLTNLIGFCLQPMILFAYIAIFLTIMDKTLIGNASFYGNGPNKTISCSEYCADTNGNKIQMTLDPTCGPDDPCNANVDANCDHTGNSFIDPMNSSFACIINIDSFGKFPGFEIIGISIPIITNLFNGNVKAKILTVVKAALVMFILCQFIDQIPGIATYLVGGSDLGPGSSVFGQAKGMIAKTMGASRSIQKRGQRAAWKAGQGDAVMNKGKEYVNHALNRDK